MIGVFEIVSESFDIFLANWKKYIILSALGLLPSIIFVSGFAYFGLSFDQNIDLYSLVNNNSIQIALVLVSFFVLQIFTQTIIYISNLLISDNNNLTVKSSLKKSWNLLLPISIAGLLTFAIIFGGLVLFIIPGFVFMIWYVYTLLSVIDGKRKMDALRSSKILVKGRFWQTLLRVLAPSLIFGIAGYVIQLPFNMLGSLIHSLFPNNIVLAVTNVVGSSVQSLITTPLMAIAIYVLYRSAKQTVKI